MRTLLLAGVLASLAVPAFAETVIRTESRPSTVVREETTGTVERKTVTRTDDGTGCGSKTVHKEDGLGNSKTVTKEGCD